MEATCYNESDDPLWARLVVRCSAGTVAVTPWTRIPAHDSATLGAERPNGTPVSISITFQQG
ncbi:hypothetical protein GCM10012275_11550 [Longimycelium tulufanense]|uniref:Uncharacterized protein n=1 Tax=Longimycelium tulufanense TaxID=907463 RepID=A0A8J3C8T4_9PSEU|nr:hypothetical protein [Longimycelium tulufanense]GGM42261.1 hypothetical protein GCM10012275_11550 [Longimycelium tulufanense]